MGEPVDNVCKSIRDKSENIEKILLSLNILLNNLLEIPTHNPKSHLPNTKKRLSVVKGPMLSPTKRKLQKLSDDFEGLGKKISELDSLNKNGRTVPKERGQLYLLEGYKTRVSDWNSNQKDAEVYKNNILVSFRINGNLYRFIRGDRDISGEVTEILESINGLLAIIQKFK